MLTGLKGESTLRTQEGVESSGKQSVERRAEDECEVMDA
jgi:hypothetical protein